MAKVPEKTKNMKRYIFHQFESSRREIVECKVETKRKKKEDNLYLWEYTSCGWKKKQQMVEDSIIYKSKISVVVLHSTHSIFLNFVAMYLDEYGGHTLSLIDENLNVIAIVENTLL